MGPCKLQNRLWVVYTEMSVKKKRVNMRNILSNYKTVVLLVTSLGFMCSCATISQLKDGQVLHGLEESLLKVPLFLHLKSVRGEVDRVFIYTEAINQHHINGRSPVLKKNITSFLVEIENLGVDTENHLNQRVHVLNKEGESDLHDYAYPRLGEVFNYQYKRNGEVLQVENFPRDSLFYVPAISLPKGKKGKGDTWALQRSWWDSKNNVQLNLDMVTILESFLECGEGHICALLSIDGKVTIPSMVNSIESGFLGRLSGEILFSVEKGVVLVSNIKSEEALQIGDETIETHSCLKSVLISSKVARGFKKSKSCE